MNYYFCVVENSLGDDTKTTKSNMIEVVVQEKTVETVWRNYRQFRNIRCLYYPAVCFPHTLCVHFQHLAVVGIETVNLDFHIRGLGIDRSPPFP